MSTQPDWLNMNLSELVDKSLKLGVVPFFEFKNKDEIESGTLVKHKSMMDQTPVDVLKKEIELYERFISKIKTREGIDLNAPDLDKKLKRLEKKLRNKIIAFNRAVQLLKLAK